MEKKFTPGPWYPVNYAGYLVIQDSDYYENDSDLLNMEKCKNAEANSILCAAAPDLLAALEIILNQFKLVSPLYSKDREIIRQAEVAISKALTLK